MLSVSEPRTGILRFCFKLLQNVFFFYILSCVEHPRLLHCSYCAAPLQKRTDACSHTHSHTKHTFSALCRASLLPPLPWWLHCMFELSITLQQKHFSLPLTLSLFLSRSPSSFSSAPCYCTRMCRLVKKWRFEVWYGLYPGWHIYTISASADSSRRVRL